MAIDPTIATMQMQRHRAAHNYLPGETTESHSLVSSVTRVPVAL
jgi:hypothetical protein